MSHNTHAEYFLGVPQDLMGAAILEAADREDQLPILITLTRAGDDEMQVELITTIGKSAAPNIGALLAHLGTGLAEQAATENGETA